MQAQVYKDIYENELHHWWYKMRRALVHELLNRCVSNVSSQKILDVGCGVGGLMNELRTKGEVFGVDFSKDAIDFCRERELKNIQQGDVTNLPFEDGFFDVVVCLDVLEHVEDDAQGVRELYRVLKPGGCAIIFVPALMVLWGETDVVSEHKRRYTKAQLIRILQDVNFSILRASYFNSLLFIPIFFVRLLARVMHSNLVNEYKPGNGVVNNLLYLIVKWELLLLRYVSFPVGVSIFSVCKK